MIGEFAEAYAEYQISRLALDMELKKIFEMLKDLKENKHEDRKV